SRSRASSARPTWAMPKVTAARVGGFRFEMAAPLTPTMLGGYPAQATSAAVAAAPPVSMSAGVSQPRNAPRAHAMPSRYGTIQPAATLTQPAQAGPPRPKRTRSAPATTAAGNSAARAPNRRTIATASGVAAISAAYTPRNHSGSRTSLSRVPTVGPGIPPRLSPTAAMAHTATSATTGRDSRARRLRSQAR